MQGTGKLRLWNICNLKQILDQGVKYNLVFVVTMTIWVPYHANNHMAFEKKLNILK